MTDEQDGTNEEERQRILGKGEGKRVVRDRETPRMLSTILGKGANNGLSN